MSFGSSPEGGSHHVLCLIVRCNCIGQWVLQGALPPLVIRDVETRMGWNCTTADASVPTGRPGRLTKLATSAGTIPCSGSGMALGCTVAKLWLSARSDSPLQGPSERALIQRKHVTCTL